MERLRKEEWSKTVWQAFRANPTERERERERERAIWSCHPFVASGNQQYFDFGKIKPEV